MAKLDSILLIDDDEVTNFINKDIIESLQIAESVTVCNNGQEAIDYLINCADSNKNLPNIIFLDVNMPEMDGFAFLEAFNKHFTHEDSTMVALLTTSTRRQDVKQALSMKHIVHGYVEKPLTRERVQELVKKYHYQVNLSQGNGANS